LQSRRKNPELIYWAGQGDLQTNQAGKNVIIIWQLYKYFYCYKFIFIHEIHTKFSNQNPSGKPNGSILEQSLNMTARPRHSSRIRNKITSKYL
jgi:hypothetical protein